MKVAINDVENGDNFSDRNNEARTKITEHVLGDTINFLSSNDRLLELGGLNHATNLPAGITLLDESCLSRTSYINYPIKPFELDSIPLGELYSSLRKKYEGRHATATTLHCSGLRSG